MMRLTAVSRLSRLGVRILLSIGAVAALGQSAGAMAVADFVAAAHYFNPCFNNSAAMFRSLNGLAPYGLSDHVGAALEARSSADFYDGITDQFFSIEATNRAMWTALRLRPDFADRCGQVEVGETRVTFPVLIFGITFASSQESCERPLAVEGATARPIGFVAAHHRAQLRIVAKIKQLERLHLSPQTDDMRSGLGPRQQRELVHLSHACSVFMDEHSRARVAALLDAIAP